MQNAFEFCFQESFGFGSEKFGSRYLSGFGTCPAILRNGCQDVNGPVPRSFLISNESKSDANIIAFAKNKNPCLHSPSNNLK